MKTTHFFAVLALALGALASSAGATELESVSGSGGVLLTRAGKVQPAEEGDTLQAGDGVAVGAKTAARLLFDDGTHLTLAEGCAVEIARPLQGAAGVVLKRGSLTANVAKAPPTAPPSSAPAAAPPLKFFIKTNAAVMGVRGTEFVVDHDDKAGSEVHTLDGTVDVAANEEDLSAGRGRRVEALQQLRADKRGLGQPTKFERAAFERTRGKRHGIAADLGRRAVRSPEERRARRDALEQRRKDTPRGPQEGRGGRGDGPGRQKEAARGQKDGPHERKEGAHERKDAAHDRKEGAHERKEAVQDRKEAAHERKEAALERKDAATERKEGLEDRKERRRDRD